MIKNRSKLIEAYQKVSIKDINKCKEMIDSKKDNKNEKKETK